MSEIFRYCRSQIHLVDFLDLKEKVSNFVLELKALDFYSSEGRLSLKSMLYKLRVFESQAQKSFFQFSVVINDSCV